VAGDGPVNLRVSSPSNDGAAYDSREAGATLAPQLILTVAGTAVPDVSPPSAPSGLAATAVSPTRIDLSWGAATDDVRVAGYRIFRGGAELATTPETTYTDTAVLPGTSYAYHVVAYDDSGKVSPPSNTTSAVTPLGDRTLTFTPTDDAYVLRNTPAANTGTARDLHVDNSPVKAFLLKFDVSGIGSGTVTGAKLRLHVLDGSNLGGLFSTTQSSWTQSAVTWATAPATGPRVATLNSVAAGTWREVALATGAVTADGAVSFRVDSTSSDGADYDSKEAGPALAPQLILTVSALPAFVWNALR
jgi:chitodextrinase